MGIFNIPNGLVSLHEDTLFDANENRNLTPVNQTRISSPIDWDSGYTFEMRVIPETQSQPGETPYKLALYQRYVEPPAAQQKLDSHSPFQFHPLAILGGNLLKAVTDQILETLLQNGYQATDLSADRREAFPNGGLFGSVIFNGKTHHHVESLRNHIYWNPVDDEWGIVFTKKNCPRRNLETRNFYWNF
jgi:hypothetical protein